MNLYPALRMEMGTWTYYVVKMSARELAENVQFAHDVYTDRTLGEAIQRILKTRRVKTEIVRYLKRQKDRFFSSLVVAALDGDPTFYPVNIADDPQFQIFRDDQRLNESFGVLRFDGTQKYYALDGQHRLAAIKALCDRADPDSDEAPPGFDNDEYSVIVVVPSQDDTDQVFLQKYRRLFSNLNRYAKSTDQCTNIIMDEDDAFAVVTRWLLTEHEFFRTEGRQRESFRIKTEKGKNLKEGESYFTSLETLYDMNIKLLTSRLRRNRGWGEEDDGAGNVDLKAFKLFRPSDEYLEGLHKELTIYWDCILEELPDLRRPPAYMRAHPTEDTPVDDSEFTDHLLFWPIGQLLLADIVRSMLDVRLEEHRLETPTYEQVRRAVEGLNRVEWRLYYPPWRYLLLVKDGAGRWKMRSEQRNDAIRVGYRILRWMVGLDELDAELEAELKTTWGALLIPAQNEDTQNSMWQDVVRQVQT